MIHCTGFQAVSFFEQWDPLNSDMREGAAVCEHCSKQARWLGPPYPTPTSSQARP